ncbi:MAG: hypothetical protein ABI620_09125, partial [Chloroflexota bacterium]
MTNDFRPRSMRLALGAAGLSLLLVAACTPAATFSPPPSVAPGSTTGPNTPPPPTSTPVADGISHPTGAADVVLRMESGGGFVPIEFLATGAPSFTLYGDGTAVFRDPSVAPPAGGNVNRLAPFQTIRLDEEGIQALLADAIGRGGLGIAAGPYIGQGADLPTTTFTINADGGTKEVSVMALLPEMHPQDVAIITALAGLAQRLDGFAAAVAGEHVYEPTSYRGILMATDQAVGPVLDWPWPAIKPAEFVAGANEFLMVRTLSAADVSALGIPGIEGGLQGLTLKESDGKLSLFSLRPLLPDET